MEKLDGFKSNYAALGKAFHAGLKKAAEKVADTITNAAVGQAQSLDADVAKGISAPQNRGQTHTPKDGTGVIVPDHKPTRKGPSVGMEFGAYHPDSAKLEYGDVGESATPFMRPAIDQTRPSALRIAGKALKGVLNRDQSLKVTRDAE